MESFFSRKETNGQELLTAILSHQQHDQGWKPTKVKEKKGQCPFPNVKEWKRKEDSIIKAVVAELADATDLKSVEGILHVGSSPTDRIILQDCVYINSTGGY